MAEGEGTKVINDMLKNAGFEIIGEGFKHQWNPDEEAKQKAVDFGKEIAKA